MAVKKALSMYPAVKSTKKVSLLTPGLVPSTDPCQEEGRQRSSPGSCTARSYSLANSPISPLALGALSLCSTGINGMANLLCMGDFQSWLDAPDPQQPLIPQ